MQIWMVLGLRLMMFQKYTIVHSNTSPGRHTLTHIMMSSGVFSDLTKGSYRAHYTDWTICWDYEILAWYLVHFLAARMECVFPLSSFCWFSPQCVWPAGRHHQFLLLPNNHFIPGSHLLTCCSNHQSDHHFPARMELVLCFGQISMTLRVFAPVHLFVCLSAGLCKIYRPDFHETWW